MLLGFGGRSHERDDHVRELARWSVITDDAGGLHGPAQASRDFSTILLLYPFSAGEDRNSVRDLSIPLRELLRRVLDGQRHQRSVIGYGDG